MAGVHIRDETVILNSNTMLEFRPELINEWDFDKNDEIGLDVYTIKKSSNKKAWWVCPKCESSYDMRIADKTIKNSNCSFCSGRKVNETNSLASLVPKVASQWHPVMNGDFTPNDVTCSSNKKAWWLCNDCKSSYYSKIALKAVYGLNCPYCSGKKVNHTNSLATLNPELSKEWHPTLNGELIPHEVTCNSGKKVWWLGTCNHEWRANIYSRHSKSYGCPYCYGGRVLKGYNDMWTTNPELSKLLVNLKEGYMNTVKSVKKVDWKCPDCKNNIIGKSIYHINKVGLVCPICSDGKSYPEKVMYSLLQQLKIKFQGEKGFIWSEQKRYDFYLIDYNTIIEVHGDQHYTRGFIGVGNASLEEEQENDRFKERLAKFNGIEEYVIIEAKNSDFAMMKKSILNSKLNTLTGFDNIDWKLLYEDSLKSIVKKTVKMWNSGISINEISKQLKINKVTVRRYLHRCTENGLCNYIPTEYNDNKKREVVQLDINDGSLIKTWESISSAEKGLKLYHIGGCCRGTRNVCGDFRWMFLKDYDKYIEGKDIQNSSTGFN